MPYTETFYRCLSSLETVQPDSLDERKGVEIVRKALTTPCATIAKNAGVDPSIVVQKVLTSTSPNEGYDALHDRYVDMIEEGERQFATYVYLCVHSPPPGIIDPAKVVRSSLQDAAGVASLLTTAEVTITEIPKKEEPMPPGGMGGMGGMGM